MSKYAAMSASFLIGMSVLVVGLGPDAVAAGSSPVPPKNLKLVGDHWTPWDPPTPGSGDYVVQKGDTLWDLSEKWLGDPYLWPQIWDENRYVLDSHWIYPGDPLVVPGKPVVVPPEGPGELTGEDTTAQDGPLVAENVEPEVDAGFGRDAPAASSSRVPDPMPAPLLPVADPADIYCTGFIDPGYVSSEVIIAGGELEREHLGQGDIVYLNQGLNQGVEPGAEMAIWRPTRSVGHPVSGESLGTYVRRLGKVRIIAVQNNTSTAIIEDACEDIVKGDQLVGWSEIPIPMMAGMPAFDRWDAVPSGGSQGYVVAIQDEMAIAGTGNVVHVDLGAGSEAEPGDVLTVFRDNGDLPRMNLGQAVVLTVEASTSTVKITHSVRESWIGDRVEIVR